MKVYLLYDYGEYGPEYLTATLDVNCLPAMVEREWPELDCETPLSTPRMVVEQWIKEGCKSDKLSLAIGWGAPILSVVELEAGPESGGA